MVITITITTRIRMLGMIILDAAAESDAMTCARVDHLRSPGAGSEYL